MLYDILIRAKPGTGTLYYTCSLAALQPCSLAALQAVEYNDSKQTEQNYNKILKDAMQSQDISMPMHRITPKTAAPRRSQKRNISS